jgi:hypothetical protein
MDESQSPVPGDHRPERGIVSEALDLILPAPGDLGDVVDGWPENVEHISASSLKTFVRCPERYRRRYLLGEKQPPAAAHLWGRADHGAIEHNFEQKVESHADLSLAEIQERFAHLLDTEVEESGGLNELLWKPDERSRKKAVIADVKDRGVEGVTQYHKHVSPTVQPIVVEESFVIPPERLGTPVEIHGRIDVVAAESAIDELPERIVDRKTTAKKASKISPEWSVQGGIYQMHRWVPHEWQVTVKTQKPYVQVGDDHLTIKASPFRKKWIERYVQSLVKQLAWCYVEFGAEQPWPGALMHDWACAPAYCGFRSTCPWWAA